MSKILYRTPPLPNFSGILPVPKGEGSYEQLVFQLHGFRNNYSEQAIKSSMIGAVTDGARDYLDFIGFDKSLNVLIDALDRRYGKGQTTDKIQQEFYQLSQERGETVQELTKYKKLIELYPGRYNVEILKERLFYGMTQHLQDSMRYLYKRPETNYDELLLTAKEAECEWTEQKSLKSKATVTKITKDERDDIKQRLDKLAETVKAASFQKRTLGYKKKIRHLPQPHHRLHPVGPPGTPGEDLMLPQQAPFMGIVNQYNVGNVEGGAM